MSEEILYSNTFVSKVLGISERRLIQLINEGILQREGRGKINLVETVQRYITYRENLLRPQTQTGQNAGDIKNDAARKLKAEADILELKRQQEEIELAKVKGDVIQTAEILSIMNRAISKLSNDIEQMPRILSQSCNPEEPQFAEKSIRDYVEKVIKKTMQQAFIKSVEEEQKAIESEETAKRQGAGEKKTLTVKAKKRAPKKTTKGKRGRPKKATTI